VIGMTFPTPVQGLVIRYSYLWRAEHLRGQEEGAKSHPCAVILVTTTEGGVQVATVLPITHTPPADNRLAVEIPYTTKQRLGLDAERSWVVLSEANRFVWPGPDLQPIRGDDAASVAYGLLPYGLIEEIRLKVIGLVRMHLSKVVLRTD
jgi:hypothetical protein